MARVKIHYSGKTQQKKAVFQELGKKLDIKKSIDSLIKSLQGFEARYGMSTVEFYARYAAGEVGDNRDFVKWAGSFEIYQQVLKKHFLQGTKAA
jgi:hypothetical protein